MKNHLLHYTPLVGILSAALLGFVFVSYDKAFRGAIIIASAFAYLTWGIIHHYLHKDLYFIVVVEYIIIALFGAVIGLSVIFNL